jgi:hypothetical protein
LTEGAVVVGGAADGADVDAAPAAADVGLALAVERARLTQSFQRGRAFGQQRDRQD